MFRGPETTLSWTSALYFTLTFTVANRNVVFKRVVLVWGQFRRIFAFLTTKKTHNTYLYPGNHFFLHFLIIPDDASVVSETYVVGSVQVSMLWFVSRMRHHQRFHWYPRIRVRVLHNNLGIKNMVFKFVHNIFTNIYGNFRNCRCCCCTNHFRTIWQ